MSQKIVAGRHQTETATLANYVTGFVLSVALTIIPYSIVVADLLNGWALTGALVFFALAQLMVQLQFFIHLGHESGTPWNKIIFLFMLLVVFIIVGGSLWIMKNLDYRHPSGGTKDGSHTETKADDYPHYDRNFNPEQTEEYIITDEGFKR